MVTPNAKKPIHITKRDKKLLEVVRDFGLVTTEQLRYLLFPSFSRARKRLKQLWEHGFLARIERPTRLGEGTKAKIYRISKKGTLVIGFPADRPYRIASSQMISSGFAEHHLCINKFRVCLMRSSEITHGLSLLKWVSDRKVKKSAQVKIRDRQLTVPIVPDASFTLWTSNRSFAYFMEVDRGTASLDRIRTKLLAYHELFIKPDHDCAGHRTGFRVLIVTDSQRRKERILEAIRALPSRVRRPDIFLTACSQDFGYEAPEQVLGPIWTIVSSTRSLLHGQTIIPSIRRSPQGQVNHLYIGQAPTNGIVEGPGG